MRPMIEVQPAPGLLRDFARWATDQTPKVRTVSPRAFAVPDDLFVAAPEELLIGALVDGQRYRSPAEDAANGTPPPGGQLLGVATAEGFAATGDPSADAAAMVAPSNRAGDQDDQDDQEGGEEGDGEPFACDQCGRTFATERGRDSHRRQAHPTED